MTSLLDRRSGWGFPTATRSETNVCHWYSILAKICVCPKILVKLPSITKSFRAIDRVNADSKISHSPSSWQMIYFTGAATILQIL